MVRGRAPVFVKKGRIQGGLRKRWVSPLGGGSSDWRHGG